jgi:tetratricopeptide (TPR) repeat protein
MNNYVIKKDFIELKRLYENGNIERFDKKLLDYSIQELLEFAAYFSLNITSKEEYYNVKVVAEIMYNILIKSKICKNMDDLLNYAVSVIGRCIRISVDKEFWNDVIKYGLLLMHYVSDVEEKNALIDYLSLAYFYQGNFQKELKFRKQILDNNDYLSLYNYALALFHDRQYVEARLYYNFCLEKFKFPPAFRNQAHISVILDDNYVEAYEFCQKALDTYYENKSEFPLVNPFIYLIQQLLLCGLCSNDNLLSKLSVHKEKFEKGIQDNSELKNNVHIIRFIDSCSMMNRGIYQFEKTDFKKSVELFDQVIQNIDEEKGNLDYNTYAFNIFCDKLKDVANIYILLVKIIVSFDILFDESITSLNIDDKLKKINQIEKILINNRDDDFTYEYKKVIILFLNYISAILEDFLKGNRSKVINLTEYVNQLRLTKNNYILSKFSLSLFSLVNIVKDYDENIKYALFEDDFRNSQLKRIKEICDNFCTNVKTLTSSFAIESGYYSCSNSDFSEKIISAIFHMKKNIPDYIKNYKLDNKNSLQEENFRDTLGFYFCSIYDVSSEEWRKEGRTDLIVKIGNNNEKVIEFKIWGRNDYKDIVEQIVKRYLTEFDDVGYVFMVNPNKSPINDKYMENIKETKTGYILDSLQVKTLNNFKYYITRHKTNFSEYKIYHFIFNVYE